MLIRYPRGIAPSEITPRGIHARRREFIKSTGLTALAGVTGMFPLTGRGQGGSGPGRGLPGVSASEYRIADKANTYKEITSYNNYYEFGTDKEDPAFFAHKLRVRPWAVVVEGEVQKPKTFGIEELLKFPLEERSYRLRCVEGWSMVIPWVGFEFSRIARQVEPTGKAKFVEFVSAYQPDTMPGVHLPMLEWPYREGLRIDEAMHPLVLMAVGLYGQVLPNQNGAPVRLVVPWKYGFKSAKSIVRIRFIEKQPKTAWEKAAPQEYGFYANVNPEVDHPRWSQATERRIGEDGLFTPKRKTLPFNGYGDQVASLYAGMDLRRNF